MHLASEALPGAGTLASIGTGQGVRVAIVDTGIQPDHPKVGPVQGGVGFELDASGNPVATDEWGDRHGHGTACASVVRRLAPDAELLSVRISDENALSSIPLLVEAISWAVRAGVHIVHASLGTQGQAGLDRLRDVCREARDAGTVVVAAESNEGLVTYPSQLPTVVAVGGAPTKGLFHFYRDPVEPSRFLGHDGKQRVAWIAGEQRFLGGTSMAACQITGLLALLRQRETGDAGRLVQALTGYAQTLDSVSPDHEVLSTGKIGRRTLVEQPPPLERVALYPFAKEMHSLVRFRGLLPFQIGAVMDPLGHGSAGRDAGTVLGLPEIGIPVVPLNTSLLDGVDALVLGHMDRLRAARRTDTASELLREALRRGVHVYSFDDLGAYAMLVDEAREAGLWWQSPGIETDGAVLAETELFAKEMVDRPVLGVFGTRSGQGKFTVQMALKKALTDAGYDVGHLATEPQAPLFGCDAVFPMGYGASVPFTPFGWVAYLNHQVLAIAEHASPEVILVGAQSGTIPRDPHLQREHLCLNSQLFLYGTRPDAVVLVVEPHPDEEEAAYTRETITAIETLGRTKVIAVAFSNRAVELVEGRTRKLRRYRFLDAGECDAAARRLEESYARPAFAPVLDEGSRGLVEAVIDSFRRR